MFVIPHKPGKWQRVKSHCCSKDPYQTILQEMHNHFGHFGIGKTYSLIKRYYYWPKMIKQIQAHVVSCSLCWREKLQADKYQLQNIEIPGRAFAKVSTDLIVELPTSHYNKNILVMVDHFTGWPIAKAIPNKEATTVANAIFQKLILEHGALHEDACCIMAHFLTVFLVVLRQFCTVLHIYIYILYLDKWSECGIWNLRNGSISPCFSRTISLRRTILLPATWFSVRFCWKTVDILGIIHFYVHYTITF